MVKLYKERNGKACHNYLDEEHPYIDYTPVSTVKSHCYPEFNPNQAKISSENPHSKWFGQSPSDIQTEWERLRDVGLDNGECIHRLFENALLGLSAEDCWENVNGVKKIFSAYEEMENVYWQFMELMQTHDVFNHTIHPEVCLSMDIVGIGGLTAPAIEKLEREELTAYLIDEGYSEEYLGGVSIEAMKKWAKKNLMRVGLAGTADLIVEYENYFLVFDYKTDKTITSKGYMGEKMSYPLQNLQACNLEMYSLQVWMYIIMAEAWLKKEYRGGHILHFNKEKKRITILNILPRKQEARTLLQYFFKIGVFKAA